MNTVTATVPCVSANEPVEAAATGHPAARSEGGTNGYRPDIQGLRGVAVLLVVAYHADTFITGGYVGVDVFFVVSGYVITRLLLTEFESQDRLRFGRFYLRRIRRILPALALTLAVTLVLSIGLTPVRAQQVTARTGAAAALVNANTYLVREGDGGGYFGAAAESNPLLHTWSLSVEEQFYLIFPALLAGAWALARRFSFGGPRALAGILTAIVVASFPLSILMTNATVNPSGLGPRIAFYSAPTRAWEFAVGGLLAVLAARGLAVRGRFSAAAMAVVGGMVLALTVVEFDDRTTFPGLAALAPVLATGLLIAAGEVRRQGGAARALAWSPLRWVGDLSYSWYLWHWPLIVFAAAYWPTTPGVKAMAAVASLIAAWLSFRLVENPIRFRKSPQTSRTLALGAACVVVPLIASFALEAGYRVLRDADLFTPFALHADVQRGCDARVSVEPSRTRVFVAGRGTER